MLAKSNAANLSFSLDASVCCGAVSGPLAGFPIRGTHAQADKQRIAANITTKTFFKIIPTFVKVCHYYTPFSNICKCFLQIVFLK
jgi:hypothetical protein